MKLAKRLVLTTTAVAAVSAGTLFSATVGQAATSAARPHRRRRRRTEGPRRQPAHRRLLGRGRPDLHLRRRRLELLEPAATLWAKNDRSHRPVALHSRGPVWVSTVDGSAVNAAAIANSPKTGTIPASPSPSIATRGTGAFAGVSYVQRLDTHGGVAPSTACTGTDQISVRYSATYAFYKPAK